MSETLEKTSTIFLIGNVDHEGRVSLIKTSRFRYQRRNLHSTPDNWAKIVEELRISNVAAVVLKLTSAVYCSLHSPRYASIANELLSLIAAQRNMVFAYDSLLDLNKPSNEDDDDEIEDVEGEYDEDGEYYLAYKHQIPPGELRAFVNEKLAKAGLRPICYSTNAELTVMASQFLREVASNLLFRLYVPHGRLYATEMDKLLQLFKIT